MAQSVDTILDDAADGLRYFEDFIDEYKRAYGGYYKSHELSYLYMRYDEQRGMDLAKLSAAATGLQSALKDADQEWNTQTGLSKQLPNVWQGEASTAAQDMFGKQLAQSSDDKTKSRAVLDAIGSTVTGLQTAVQGKADFVKTLLGPSGAVLSGGKTKGEVDTIISGANMGLTSDIGRNTLIQRLEGIFPDQRLGGSVGATWTHLTDASSYFGIIDGDHGYGKRLKDRCQDWLDKVFKPDFEGKVNNFLGHCDTTNTSIEQAYATLVQAAQQVTHKPFVRPVGTSTSKANPSTPGPSTASPSTASPSTASPSTSTASPSTTTTNSPSNTKTTTSSFDPSSLISQASSALNGLGSLGTELSSLGQTVSKDFSSLSTTIQQGVQSFVSQVEGLAKDAAGSTGGKKLEFDIAGKHVKLGLGKDGAVDISTSDGSGDSKSYAMKLDEHGLPVITSTDDSKDDKKSDGDQSGADTAKSHGSGSGSDSSGGSGSQNSGGTSAGTQYSGTQHSDSGTQNSASSQSADSSSSGSQFSGTMPTPAASGSGDDKKPSTPVSVQQPKPSTTNDTGAELPEAGPL